jgi:hypothetical protein
LVTKLLFRFASLMVWYAPTRYLVNSGEDMAILLEGLYFSVFLKRCSAHTRSLQVGGWKWTPTSQVPDYAHLMFHSTTHMLRFVRALLNAPSRPAIPLVVDVSVGLWTAMWTHKRWEAGKRAVGVQIADQTR